MFWFMVFFYFVDSTGFCNQVAVIGCCFVLPLMHGVTLVMAINIKYLLSANNFPSLTFNIIVIIFFCFVLLFDVIIVIVSQQMSLSFSFLI